ncbi:MAG: NAD(P) transhydrogenase subunit alpha [Porphyromonas sp.]|nr:NAD(P) transhydrogenase subunit alpha [Porphyromonas sp.]
MSNPFVLILIFIVSALVGYFVIRKIPSLLHTPLMSGMNALSGITLIGAIIVLTDTLRLISMMQELGIKEKGHLYFALILSGIAIILAMINVVGGFGVTDRMLRMFDKKKPTTHKERKEVNDGASN